MSNENNFHNFHEYQIKMFVLFTSRLGKCFSLMLLYKKKYEDM